MGFFLSHFDTLFIYNQPDETQQVNFDSIIILMVMLMMMMMLMIFESYEKCYNTTIESARAHTHASTLSYMYLSLSVCAWFHITSISSNLWNCSH